MRAPALLAVSVLLLLLAMPAAASASGSPFLVPPVATPENPDIIPPGYLISPRQAAQIAERTDLVRKERLKHPQLRRTVGAPLYMADKRWSVDYYVPGGSDGVAEIQVDAVTRKVIEQWTGPQVQWTLARGYDPPTAGRLVNHWYVWIPLCLLFIAPFFDPRKPFRLLHLDLLMLVGFSASQFFEKHGNLDVSVPLAYPFLAYVFGRLLFAGFRPRERRGPIVPLVPMRVLLIGLVVLVGFRVAINVADGSVIDVGLASAIGADRIEHKQQLYTDNSIHGDTYGPVTYVAYIPFELILPYKDSQVRPPAAQAAAVTFDLLTIVALVLLGARIRPGPEGRRLGLAMAFAWTAYPFTAYVLQSGTNDALTSFLVVIAMLGLRSPPARGALLGLATAAKFIPLALAPLFAAGTGDRRPSSLLRFAVTLTLVLAGSVLIYLPDGGLREFWNATLGYQLHRDSPFSIWGLHPALDPIKSVLTVAVAGLALAVFFVPKRRDARQVAALAGALIVGLQLIAAHWFYFYIVWFLPLVLVAVFGAYRSSDQPAEGAPELEAELAAA